jgi:hypothetical protein
VPVSLTPSATSGEIQTSIVQMGHVPVLVGPPPLNTSF